MSWGAGDGGQGRANLGRWEMVRDDELREQGSRHIYDEDSGESDAEDSPKHSTRRGFIFIIVGIIVVALVIGLLWFVL